MCSSDLADYFSAGGSVDTECCIFCDFIFASGTDPNFGDCVSCEAFSGLDELTPALAPLTLTRSLRLYADKPLGCSRADGNISYKRMNSRYISRL